MKKNSFLKLIPGFLFLLMVSSACNRAGHKIYTLVPDNVSFVGTIHPGKLLDKANPQEVEFIRRELGDNEFGKALLEDPSVTGIDINAYSCFFIFGTDERYLGVVLPLKKQQDFEDFLDELSKQDDEELTIEKAENYSFTMEGNNILAWNKSLVINLTRLNGWGETGTKEKLDELFTLEEENTILSETDFKSFLKKQKDINLWATSSQLESLTGAELGILNLIGAVNNNYAHVFLDFQNGAILLSSNLNLNPDFKKNYDKFNVIDQDAGKEILKMLPAKDLLIAGNLKFNSEKMLDLLNSLNTGDNHFMEEFEGELGQKPEEVLKSVQGSLAFSVNGITDAAGMDEDNGYPIPVVVAVMQLNDEKVFKDFIGNVQRNEPITEKDGYYLIQAEDVPFFLAVKNNNIILTNKEEFITSILADGEIKENVLSLDISKTLANNPICLYVNLDRESYSGMVNDYIDGEMNPALVVGLEGFGKSLSSLTVSGNIEKSELRVEFKDKSINSLHAILQALN